MVWLMPAVTKKAYDRARPTHFLSFPLSSPLITRKLGEFQSSVLSSTFQCKGIDPSIMVLSANLHLTLGVFKLLNQAEIEKAVRFLKDTIPGVIDNILQKKLLSVHLKQLATMQTNQADAHVLYVQVHDETQEKVLKDVCTAIIDAMVEEGFMVRDTRPLKLHATLINTSNRASSSGASKDEKRQPFDARPIMKSFSHLDLGVAHLDKLHLMKMGRTGPGKTYVSEGSISLTQ
ncbi:kinase A anchor protein [Radiomyces spectabilis]|uniref:kinase A anchor protein n=1 Tax=Radiomyces spectabilis TaxID=64574 RepID=UPI002221109F|nr:kinase A anchor protein [Radiomyces spectabilis]KAI8374749.1 kinase A anchor protein [Radiomyces spectabilis]